MLACCAYHLTDVLPILGLSSAAIFLDLYTTPLLWLGIGMNLASIIFILRKIREQRGLLIPTVGHPLFRG
jgi:hypothetical protein